MITLVPRSNRWTGTVACVLLVSLALLADMPGPAPAADTPAKAPRLLGVFPGSRPLVLKTASNAFAAFRDGSRVVCADDRAAELWDITTGQKLLTMKHSEVVLAVAIAPDEETLLTVTAGRGSPVRSWDLGGGKLLKEYSISLDAHVETGLMEGRQGSGRNAAENHSGWTLAHHFFVPKAGFGFTSVAFSPSGNRVVAGREDGTVTVWDTKTGESRTRLVGRKDRLSTVMFSPDGNRILSASNAATVTLWDIEKRTVVKEYYTAIHDEGEPAGQVPVSFSSDGTRFAFYDLRTQAIRVCDVKTGADLQRLPEKSLVGDGSIAFLEGDQEIVSRIGRAHVLEVWDLASGKTVRRHVYQSGVNPRYAYPNVRFAQYLPNISAITAVEVENDENTLHEDWTTVLIIPLSEFANVP